MSSQRRSAYSLIEAIVTLVVIAILALLVIPQVISSRSANDDPAAKQTLLSAAEDQAVVFSADGAFADPSVPAGLQRLQMVDNQRKFLAPDVEPSSPDQVSVALSGTDIGLASRGSTETCWLLLRKFETASGEADTLWAIDENGGQCTGSRALTLTPGSAPNNGLSSSRPIRLP